MQYPGPAGDGGQFGNGNTTGGPAGGGGGGTGEVKVPQGQPKRLHVSNIPFRFREPDLRQLFYVSKEKFCVCVYCSVQKKAIS